MKLSTALKSRRGVAVEMAIITMLIVFALCSMIITLTMFTVDKGVKEEQEFFDDFMIDTIGEDFRAAVEWGAVYDKETGSFTRSDGYVVFDPSAYAEEYDTDERKLNISVSINSKQYALKVQETITREVEAVYGDDGEIIREAYTFTTTNHLLSVTLEAETDGEDTVYRLKKWSYVA